MNGEKPNERKHTVSFKDLIAPSFYRVHHTVKSGHYDEIWLKGGRGSTKSSFVALQIIKKIMDDPDANAICFRKVGDTIRGSVHSLLLWAIEKMEMGEYFDHTTSPAEITYLPTKQKIIFRGLDKPTKVKSIALVRGHFKISWYEELEEYHSMEEIRSTQQSVARGTDDHITFFSFNPPNEADAWVNKESNIDKKGRFVHHSDYRKVPKEWLGRAFLKRAEDLKQNDREAYDHEYLGLTVGRSDRIIFAGKWREGELDTSGMDGPYYGGDFGFANDPNVFGKQWIDWDTKILYVEYAVFGYRTEINDLPDLLREIPGLCTGWGRSGKREDCKNVIRCDSARPETISYLKTHGFPGATGVKKWKGSDKDGIEFIRGSFKEIVFHPRCDKAMDEARYYSYKTNKAGDVLSEIVDANNHFWDQCRYALAPLIKERNNEADIVDPSSTGGNFFDSAIVM